MTLTVSAKRDAYFDSLKFILIALVVMGHVFDQNTNDSLSLAINNTFYLFRIPLFIFISGYFCKKDASREKKTKTILKLVETLLVFQLLSYLLGGGNLQRSVSLFMDYFNSSCMDVVVFVQSNLVATIDLCNASETCQ